MSETVTALEIIRFVVGLFGMRTCWAGRRDARRSRADIPAEAGAGIHERAGRVQRLLRMDLVADIQYVLFWVHAGFTANAAINFWYPSAPYEQLNVMSSNLLQVLAPLGLIAVSHWLSGQMGTSTHIANIVGRRPAAPADDAPEAP